MRNVIKVRTAVRAVMCGVLLMFFNTETVAQDDAAQDFQNLIFEETENFVQKEVEFDEQDWFLRAKYRHKPTGLSMQKLIQYDGRERVTEYVSSFNWSHEVAIGTERNEFFDAMEREELREIDFDEVVDNPAVTMWQIHHSTYLEDFPVADVLPFEAGSYDDRSIFELNPNHFQINYTSPETDNRMSVNLFTHGVADIRYANHECTLDEMEEVQAGGHTFYDNGNILVSHLGTVLVELEYNNEEDPAQFLGHFDFDRLAAFEYKTLDRPAEGLENARLNTDEFLALIPEPRGELTLQNVHAYDDAMHLRFDYVHDDGFEISQHIAYRDYENRLEVQMRDSSQGNFSIGYQFCVSENHSPREYVQMFKRPDEQDLINWQLENMDLAGLNPFAAYFPREIGNYVLSNFNSDESNLNFVGFYNNRDTESQVVASVRYGMGAAQQYNRYHIAGFEEDMQTHTIDGVDFFGLTVRNSYMVFAMLNEVMFEAALPETDDPENHDTNVAELTNVIEAFDVAQFRSWEAPERFATDVELMVDGYPICLAPYCMDGKLQTCEAAVFRGRLNWNLEVTYRIEDEAGPGHCRMYMEYSRNPNDDWEDKPLYFNIPRDATFRDDIMGLVTDCMEGRNPDCEGPLLDELGD